MVGSALAMTGAVFMGTATVAIRTMNYYSLNIGILVAPMGFVLGNLILCPVFMTLKLIFSPVDPRSQMLTTDLELGTSLHVFTWWDFLALTLITLMFYVM